MLIPTAQTPPGAAKETAGSRVPTLSLVAWLPQGELAHPDWIAAGRRLGSIGRCSQWWVGDWLSYGTTRWGEKYGEAAKVTGYDGKSLRNIAYVSSRFDVSRRRDSLTWSHHAELASLDPESQETWLDRITADRLSVADLRIELRASQRHNRDQADGERADEDATPSEIVCPHCGKTIQPPLAEAS